MNIILEKIKWKPSITRSIPSKNFASRRHW